MSWQAILGKEPLFKDFIRPWIENQVKRQESEEMPWEFSAFFDFFPRIGEGQDHQILFVNPDNGQEYLLNVGGTILRLSEVDSTKEYEVDRVLGFENRITSLKAALDMHYRVTAPGRDGEPAGLRECVLGFFVDGAYGCGHVPYHVYFDPPLQECYRWVEQFEATVLKLFPRAVFKNHVGRCEDCGNWLTLEELLTEHWAWGIFLCNLCNAQRKQRKAEQEARAREIKRHPVPITCVGCGEVKLVPFWRIKPGQKKYYCDKACLEKVRLEELKKHRVTLKCVRCGKEFHRQKSKVKGYKNYFHDDFCRSLFQAEYNAEHMTLYTRDLLLAMMKYKGSGCAYWGCDELQAPPGLTNQWHACKKHAQRIYQSVRSQRAKREALFVAHGLQPSNQRR